MQAGPRSGALRRRARVAASAPSVPKLRSERRRETAAARSSASWEARRAPPSRLGGLCGPPGAAPLGSPYWGREAESHGRDLHSTVVLQFRDVLFTPACQSNTETHLRRLTRWEFNRHFPVSLCIFEFSVPEC